MENQENLNLKNLIKEYKYESTTEKIRTLKHSKKIRTDVTNLLNLKKKYNKLNAGTRRNIIEKQCSFLHQNYTNIFNKVLKDNLDMNLLNKFLVILESIENGKCDQHEASVKVGQILKEIYIDSSIREAKKNDNRKKNKKVKTIKPKKVSWKEYKIMNEN
jgi:hypothetical protein